MKNFPKKPFYGHTMQRKTFSCIIVLRPLLRHLFIIIGDTSMEYASPLLLSSNNAVIVQSSSTMSRPDLNWQEFFPRPPTYPPPADNPFYAATDICFNSVQRKISGLNEYVVD